MGSGPALVVRMRTAGHTCFFPGPGLDPEVIAVRLAARAPATRKVMELLAKQPRTLTALAQEAGLPVTTMHYHVSKIVRSGALARASAGRRALALTPLGQRALEAGLNGTS